MNPRAIRRQSFVVLLVVLMFSLVGYPAIVRAQSDTFGGSVLNIRQWGISAPLGASTVTQNNGLLLSNDGTIGTFCNSPGLFGPGTGIALRKKLSGDFDIQVDFSGFSGPSSATVQAFFNVYQDQNNQLHIKRIRIDSSPDGIQTVAKVGGTLIDGPVSFDPVTSGTFRITRSGSGITTFFDGAPNFSVSGIGGDVTVSLMLFLGPGSGIGNVEYGNFTINSGTLVGPLLVCPSDGIFLSSGSFVIGDLNASVGNSVTFWGAQWAMVNSLSGGPAPSAFKGFAELTSPAPPACGGTWTTDPGNSSGPPPAVPPFLAVIASNSIAQSTPVISGAAPKIVIVETDPGYGPSPDQPGTGTVVAVFCP